MCGFFLPEDSLEVMGQPMLGQPVLRLWSLFRGS